MKRLLLAAGMLTIGFTILLIARSSQVSLLENSHSNWTLSCRPTEIPGEIVDVYEVTSAAPGPVVKSVALHNRSTSKVDAVRLGWRLFIREAPARTLLQAETALLATQLSPNERRTVEYPVVSFAEIQRQLPGFASGRYVIEVFVTDVVFDRMKKDARSGLRGRMFAFFPRSPEAIKVVTKPAAYRLLFACQDQGCEFNQQTGCYQCVTSQGFACSPAAGSSCPQSCTETRCPIIE